jgi:hypothetical protein
MGLGAANRNGFLGFAGRSTVIAAQDIFPKMETYLIEMVRS